MADSAGALGMSIDYVAVFPPIIAFGIPLILILVRGRLRAGRYELVEEVNAAFGACGKSPSFEFVKSKYTPESTYDSAFWLLLSSLPFVLVALLGLEVIFTSSGGPPGLYAKMTGWTAGSFFLLEKSEDTRQILAILGFAFAGSLLFSLNYLMRAVMNFELSPLSFLRTTIHMLLAAVTVVALWRTAVDSSVDWAALGSLWFMVAFLFGFYPDLGLRYLVSRLSWLPLKGYRDDVLSDVPGISIEVIDGIDAWIRFRLDESQISDVQNLATANPIMLYVETPYGLYQCIDWVAQAQLCTTVGVDAFLELRRRNIRTIFDLERAALRDGATPNIRAALGAVVLAGKRRPPQQSFISRITGRNAAPTAPAATAPAAAQPAPLPMPAGPQVEVFDDTDLKHLFETILDDLHVHRLRQIWEMMSCTLGARYSKLSPLHATCCEAAKTEQVAQKPTDDPESEADRKAA